MPNGGERKTPPSFIYVIFLKIRNRGQNLVYLEGKLIVLQNLENREEKEKLVYKILKIERRKRSSRQKSCEPRGEREIISKNLENREENET